jgi:hypothetical protein
MRAGLAARSCRFARTASRAATSGEALLRSFHALRLEHDGLRRCLKRLDALGKCWLVLHSIECCWLLKLDQPAAAAGST